MREAGALKAKPAFASFAPFAHLHVRSGFSYGFGTATPEELVAGASRMGYSSLALTDRDGMYGVPRFLAACSREEGGLSPIVGAEVTIEVTVQLRKPCVRGHLVLLAYSMSGYASLCKLITAYRGYRGYRGYMGAWTKEQGGQPSPSGRRDPACDLRALLEHAEDLICLTGAVPHGLLPRLMLGEGTEGLGKARYLLATLREAFGADNVYVELSDDETAGSRRRIRAVEELARRHGVPTVATGEVAYLYPEDHRLSEVLAAARHLSPLPPPLYRPTDRLYLRSPGRIARLFHDRPEALQSAAEIAGRCEGAVRLGGNSMLPEANGYAGAEARKRLISLTIRGARRRYPAAFETSRNEAGALPGVLPGVFSSQAELTKRLKRELSVIFTLGFEGYFLIAREAAEIAWEMNVPVTGRGSAANSVVAHALHLTQPEPFGERLVFERFMNEKRSDPPDIDLDVCSELRDGVRGELMRRYEKSGVAVAATANTLSLRGAVRMAARSLGYTSKETDELARNVPRHIRDRDQPDGASSEWDVALSSPAMRGHPLQDRRRYALLLELATKLEGRLSQAGTHTGGLVFAPKGMKLSEVASLEASGTRGLVRCQFDKDDIEGVLGMPKLDLLGLRTHTSLRKAGELVSKKLGRRMDPLSPPPDDRETYRLIRSGSTVGIFQLESPGQQSLQRRLGARRISDITAGVALFRPGPLTADMVTPYVLRRNGLEPYEVPLKELDDILRPTYGCLIYQEQLMSVASRLSGITLAESDMLRRAMTGGGGGDGGGAAKMRALARRFVDKAVGRGVPSEKAREVYGFLEGFGRYGFSAAHAASFAHISYATAYMLAHHPAEAYAGVLNARPGMYSPRVILNEARRRGVKILGPNLHLSEREFSVEGDGRALRVGLSYCRGLSKRAVSDILIERGKKPFVSVADLCGRTSVTTGDLENLIGGGFLDDLGRGPGLGQGQVRTRRELISDIQALPRKKRGSTRGQEEIPIEHPEGTSEGSPEGSPASWWALRQRSPVRELAGAFSAEDREREELRVLGLNVGSHPLSKGRYHNALDALGVVSSGEILSLAHGSRARAAGILESLQSPPTKSGRPIWFLQTEDTTGLLQSTIFEGVYKRHGHVLYESGAYLLDGRVEQDPRRGFSFVVEKIRALDEALSVVPNKVGISVGMGA